ncbi:MAG: ABC transporter substrate-binding protein, partial [Candidatus Eremiobacteraeota bacterium]|nr:ABC transporter substrate-binding protein [Candidatus Eremiobacteraeota bacterium]
MRLHRRTFLAAGAAAAWTYALPRPSGAADLTPFNITITHYPEQDYALPVVVAQDLGFMKAEGVDVRPIVGSSGGGTTVRNIAQGGLTMAEASTAAAIKSIVAGENLKIIAAGVQTPGTICWVAKRGSPVKAIADLEGKTVGFTQPGSVSETLLGMCLRAAGIDPAKVKTRAAGGIGENITLLISGALDAAFTVDPILTNRSRDLQLIFFARHYVPRYEQTVWMVDAKDVRNPKYAGFLRARAKGLDVVQKEPAKAIEIWARVTQTDPREERFTLKNEGADYFSGGTIDPKGFALVLEGMRAAKQLPNDKIAIDK